MGIQLFFSAFCGFVGICLGQCDSAENVLKLHAGTTASFELSITPNNGADKPNRAIFGNGRRVMVNLNPEDCFHIVPSNAVVDVVRLCVETRNVDRVDFQFYIGASGTINSTQQRAVRSGPDWERTCLSLRHGYIRCVSKVTICLSNYDDHSDEINTSKLRNVFGDFCKSVITTAPGQPDQAQCGLSSYPDAGIEGGTIPTPSIVNGWEAREHEFPWQVLLAVDGRFTCAGVIVSSDYILTAAHCVFFITDPSSVHVIMGEHRRSEFSEQRSMTVVESITVIDSYIPNNFQNDIALLRLACPIDRWSNAVQPICLPSRPQSELIGQRLTVAGWGTDAASGGNLADALQYTNVPVMNLTECATCWKPFEEILPIVPGMLCAGVCGPNPTDACRADSGGALAWKNPDGRFELFGLVSFGAGCASLFPGVYTDVFVYLDWIKSHIAV